MPPPKETLPAENHVKHRKQTGVRRHSPKEVITKSHGYSELLKELYHTRLLFVHKNTLISWIINLTAEQ